MKHLYLDNASTTRISDRVLYAMYRTHRHYFANPSSVHTLGQKAHELLELQRKKCAKILCCLPENIYFNSGATEGDNQAILSALEWGQQHNRTHIVTSSIEHPAVLNLLKILEDNKKCTITYIKPNENGVIIPTAVMRALTQQTCLVTIMACNNETGIIQPIKQISQVVHAYDSKIIMHTDATQYIPYLLPKVKEWEVDLLTFSGHKIKGPRGSGILYSNNRIPLYSLLIGGSQEKGIRAGTENLPSIVGITKALEVLYKHNNTKRSKRYEKLYCTFVNLLQQSGIDFKIFGRQCTDGNFATDRNLIPIINVGFKNVEGSALLLMLSANGIYASTGSACNSRDFTDSYVLQALQAPDEYLKGSIRFTFSKSTRIKDLEYVVKILQRLLT